MRVLQIKVNRFSEKSRKKILGRKPSKNAYSKQDSLKAEGNFLHGFSLCADTFPV